MTNTNVITIEKGIPVPEVIGRGSKIKYDFIKTMEVGDSFYINGNTPDFNPTTVKQHIYKQNATTPYRYTVRTLSGSSKNPKSIRVWRIA
tara:strand:+ start:706 stop:975 length:270 start_codon:yes stop_codon:yes gene_type:complete